MMPGAGLELAQPVELARQRRPAALGHRPVAAEEGVEVELEQALEGGDDGREVLVAAKDLDPLVDEDISREQPPATWRTT